MKEVIAIVRMNKINQTKQALAEAGFPAFTATKVLGRGKGNVDFRLLRGAENGHEEAIAQLGQGPKLIPKRMIKVAVPDQKVEAVVNVIIAANRTEHPGDGKIFIVPLIDAVRVRTSETGDKALDEALV